jgi:hypothetical protein
LSRSFFDRSINEFAIQLVKLHGYLLMKYADGKTRVWLLIESSINASCDDSGRKPSASIQTEASAGVWPIDAKQS